MSQDTVGTVLFLLGSLITVLLILLYLFSLVWVYRDSEKRGKTGCMWSFIVFFTWPIGLFLYWLLRDRDVQLWVLVFESNQHTWRGMDYIALRARWWDILDLPVTSIACDRKLSQTLECVIGVYRELKCPGSYSVYRRPVIDVHIKPWNVLLFDWACRESPEYLFR